MERFVTFSCPPRKKLISKQIGRQLLQKVWDFFEFIKPSISINFFNDIAKNSFWKGRTCDDKSFREISDVSLPHDTNGAIWIPVEIIDLNSSVGLLTRSLLVAFYWNVCFAHWTKNCNRLNYICRIPPAGEVTEKCFYCLRTGCTELP